MYPWVRCQGLIRNFYPRVKLLSQGDLADPKVKAGKEGAFKGSVEWLIKYM